MKPCPKCGYEFSTPVWWPARECSRCGDRFIPDDVKPDGFTKRNGMRVPYYCRSAPQPRWSKL